MKNEENKELKEFRIRMDLKQAELAAKLGVSESYYFKIESGQRTPSYAFLKKLKIKYPDIDIDSMFF